MTTKIEISVEGAEDMKEDDKKAKAKKAALKTLLASPNVKSDSSLGALVELLTEDD